MIDKNVLGTCGEMAFMFDCANLNNELTNVEGSWIGKIWVERTAPGCPYDCVMDVGDDHIYRIQVKASQSMTFKVEKSRLNTKGVVRSVYSNNQVDYFYFYNTITKKGYLVSFSDCINPDTGICKKEVTLRDGTTGNNQNANINHAEDYLFETVMRKLLIK